MIKVGKRLEKLITRMEISAKAGLWKEFDDAASGIYIILNRYVGDDRAYEIVSLYIAAKENSLRKKYL